MLKTWKSRAVIASLCLVTGCSLGSSANVASKVSRQGPSIQETTAPPNTQEAYRAELLRSQLRHSQQDLESAATMEEQKAIRDRIAIIERQLELVE